jgi:hypothetical protein
MGDAFRKRGHQVFAVDNFVMFGGDIPTEVYEKTDLIADIKELTADDILRRFGRPDVIWASPPCTKFSVASIGRHWIKGTNLPKTEEAAEAVELVRHTIRLVLALKPRFFFIENPRGKLRKLNFMLEMPRYTVTYCQYGDDRMKPTDIWTNHGNPGFKPMCNYGDPCHVSAPRGSKTGTQGRQRNVLRSLIPEALCEHIVDLCEEPEPGAVQRALLETARCSYG